MAAQASWISCCRNGTHFQHVLARQSPVPVDDATRPRANTACKLQVPAELRKRGLEDVCFVVRDGLKGLP